MELPRIARGPFVTKRNGASVVTEGDGSFDFGELTSGPLYLLFEGRVGFDLSMRLEDGEPRGDLEVVVPRRAWFRVRVDEPDEDLSPEFVALLGDDLRPIALRQQEDLPLRPPSWVPVHGSRTAVLSAPETARHLVAIRDEEELGRRSISLTAGEVNELTWP